MALITVFKKDDLPVTHLFIWDRQRAGNWFSSAGGMASEPSREKKSKTKTARIKMFFFHKSSLPGDLPNHSCSLLRMRAALVVENHSEIDHVQSIAFTIKFHRNRSLQTSASNLARRTIMLAFVHGEIFDHPVFYIHPHHFESRRMQDLSGRRSLVPQQRDKCFPSIPEFIVTRK